MKRFLDVFLSLLAIIFLSPLMLVICLIIICDDGMPVIFRQDRVGRGDKLFKIKKFRTMKNGAPNLSTADFEESDEYITRSGKFLRRTSLDELPQLFNVLKGDMSIVGNRPLPLYEAELLTSDAYIERFMAPAGLTGLWQVEKRGGAGKMSAEERKQLDIKYAKEFSFWLDMKILCKTLTAFVQKENV